MADPKTQRKQGASESNATPEDNKAKAENLKTQGNQALKARDFTEAVSFYGKAIELDPTNEKYYSNRAAAYLNLTKYKEALVDADKCIELKAAWARGHGRKGAALFGLRRYSDAIDAYKSALRFEPSSSHYKNEIESCKKNQKGKSTAPSSSSTAGGYVKPMLQHVMFYMQFIGHVFLILLSIMSLVPTSRTLYYYRQTLMLAAFLQAVIVISQYGRPKLQKRYWLEVLKNDETHFILAALLCMMSRPFFLGVAGHAMRSSLFLANGMRDMIRQGPRIFSPLNRPFIMDNLRKLINMRYNVNSWVATMEIISGFMLIIELMTPGRNILLIFAWWQYLRTRYVLSSHTKAAFAEIRRKLDEWLLNSTWCPGIVGKVYTTVKSFCARQASAEASQSRCSVM